jgi:tetratricopeptide (TPR) repeat protein
MIYTTIRAVRFGNIILLSALLCGSLAAHAADDKLAEAQKFYLAGDWEKAKNAYSEVLTSSDAEKLEPAFFYNLGTASAKIGANGLGYVYLLKALSAKPWDSDILHNLQLTEGKLSAPVHAIQPITWISSWPLAAHFFSEEAYSLPTLISLAFLLWALGSNHRRNRIWILSAIFILSLALGITGITQTHSPVAGFVKSAQVKSGPSATFSNIVALEPGSLVNIEDSRDGWIKIRFTGADLQEAVGWIEAGALLRLR